MRIWRSLYGDGHAPLSRRLGGGEGNLERRKAVLSGGCDGLALLDGADKGDQLGGVGLGEALGEVRHVVVHGAGTRIAGDRREALVPDLEAAAVAEDVGVDVVAVARLARVHDGADGAAAEAEVEHSGGPVVGVAEVLGLAAEGRTEGGDALHLEASDEARDVEVVDGHVDELSAAAEDVLAGRRIRVV